MKSKKTVILVLIILAAALICAAVLYKNLSSKVPSSETVVSENTEAGETVPYEAPETKQEVTENESASPDVTEEQSGQAEPEEPASTPEEEPASDLPDAADFTVDDKDGAEVRLTDMLGKPVIVNFWATWCPPCKAELPHFQKACKEYGDQIQFMMVDLMDGSRETDTTLQAFMLANGYTFPLFVDRSGDASRAYEIYSIPKTIAVTADGKLLSERIGSMTESDLADLIQKLLEN